MKTPTPIAPAASSPVTSLVAQSILRQLSGFRGYPQTKEGEAHFVREFQRVCLSVAHAEATVKSFDQDFPTIKEIRETAFTLRSKFQHQPTEKEIWEKEFGTPDPEHSARVTAQLTAAFSAEHPVLAAEQARDEMYRKIKKHLGDKPWNKITWPAIYRAKFELGYPPNLENKEERSVWDDFQKQQRAAATSSVPPS
jgi:hypothetical protein